MDIQSMLMSYYMMQPRVQEVEPVQAVDISPIRDYAAVAENIITTMYITDPNLGQHVNLEA